MTIRQAKTIENLPKCNYNLSKAMKGAGYSFQGSRAGNNYKRLRSRMDELGFFSKEAIERDITDTRKLALKKQDITNINRIDEHRAKIGGLILDRTKEEGNAPTQIIISYSNTRPVLNVEPGPSSQQLPAGEVKQLTDDKHDANAKP